MRITPIIASLFSLLLSLTAFGQPSPINRRAFALAGLAKGGDFFPTNIANTLDWWGELTPINGTWANTVHPVPDGGGVLVWTNFAPSLGGTWTADQALKPTNWVSGGGYDGTRPRLELNGSTTTRMVGPTVAPAKSNFTFIIVCNTYDTVTSNRLDHVIVTDTGQPYYLRFNAGKLEMTQGTLLTGPQTITNEWYIITVIFGGGAGSRIDTNGVTYVSGNAGTGVMDTSYLGQNSVYHGNISRVWGWLGIVPDADLAIAVAQCKKDFGFP